MPLTRRDAVLLAGTGLAAALATPALAAPGGLRATVGVFLYGGNDGWNMVIPTDARHAAYRAARGSVAIDSLEPLADSAFALHPAMAALRPLWDQGALALALNTGADAPPSHWEGQRHADGLGARLLSAPPASALATHFPATRLGHQLLAVAEALAAGRGGGYIVGQGGYDTHADQVGDDTATGTHAGLLRDLAEALAGFHRAIEALGLDGQVTAFTMSDFGRALRGNPERGTDHGWGSNQLVIGAGLERRVIGTYPELGACGDGAIRPTLAHRRYLAAVRSRS